MLEIVLEKGFHELSIDELQGVDGGGWLENAAGIGASIVFAGIQVAAMPGAGATCAAIAAAATAPVVAPLLAVGAVLFLGAAVAAAYGK